MFASCATTGGNIASRGLAPCLSDDKAYNIESMVLDASKLGMIAESKLYALDSWLAQPLWTESDADCQSGSQLQVDCIEAQRRRIIDDPPLFRGDRHALDDIPQASPWKVSPLTIEPSDAKRAAQEPKESRHTPRPLCREVPDDLESSGAYEDKLQSRVNKMKDEMQARSRAMESEFTKASKHLQAWLVKNNFYNGANSRRSSLMSYTYPLHVAAAQNNPEIVHTLLLRGADPTQGDSSGRTALQVAAKKSKGGSHQKVVMQLSAVS